jgi:signal transduction histidine kinase
MPVKEEAQERVLSPVTRLLVVLFTAVACVGLAYYAEFVLGIVVVYTHLFYIPILLAGLWYQKRAVYLALGLGLVHVLMTYYSPLPLTVNELARVASFVLVAYVIGLVSAKERRLLTELGAKNREMQHFTYTVSHDLRSPLVTIQGFVGMLRKDLEHATKEKAVTDLEYIEKAATKMDALLSDTLKLSRIGRMVNRPEDVPFGEIVQGALEQTAGDIQAHHSDVTVAEDFPSVHGDRMRIEELLVNLITNSIKYRGREPASEDRARLPQGWRGDGILRAG